MATAAHRIVVPLPYPIATANVWHFPGQAPALVDCGIATPAGRLALEQGLRQAGALPLGPSGLTVYLSHGHVDHAGNAHWLVAGGAVLAAFAQEAGMVQTFRRDGAARNAEFAAALAAHGVPAAMVVQLHERAAGIDQHTEDTPIGHILAHGQRVRLGDVRATAHFAPGHTPGSAVYATDHGELLSGDTLLEHITSNAIELRDADKGRYAQYLRTLEGLRRFVGMRVLPGHHEPFELTDALLDGHLAKHERRMRRVHAQLDAPRTAWELLPRVLPHLAQGQTFLGMCEMVGHLHALELAGAVSMRETEGVRRFLALGAVPGSPE